MIALRLGRAVCTVVAACAVAAVAAEPRNTLAGQATGTAHLHGRVVAADTGDAVRGAMVTCSTVTGGGRQIAMTDGAGLFECRDLPTSAATLRVVKAGFVETNVGPGPLPPLQAGQSHNRGDVRIVRAAVIAGRVLDASGEPLTEAIVNAWRVGYPQPGNRRIVPARASVSTNDLGEYRLYGLPAGTYYVSATAHRGLGPQIIEVSPVSSAQYVQYEGASPGSGVTFYPGTAYPAEAQTVTVRAGDQTLGIDMRLLSEPLSSLSGRVVDSRGQPVANGRVSLRSVRSDGFVASSGTVTDATGRFTLRQLGPGDYRLVVTTNLGLSAPVNVAGAPVPTQVVRSELPELATMLVTIGAGVEPRSDLLIQTRPGNELRGRVLVDGALPALGSSERFMIYMSSMAPDGTTVGAQSGGTVAADGTFIIPGLVGRGRVLPSGAPAGASLLRVIAHGLDVTDDGVDMDRGSVAGVEVHLTTRRTLVRGQVADAAGKPVSGVAIVYSENPALWSKPDTRYVVSRAASPSGAFEIAGLPAGRYLAVAVEQVVPDQWADPENLLRLRPQATPFTVVEGETVTLALRRR